MSSIKIAKDFSNSILDETQSLPDASKKSSLDEVKVEISSSSEPVIYYSENEKMEKLIMSARGPRNQAPPSYPYRDDGYRGNVGSTPIYQERNPYYTGYPEGPRDVSRTPAYRRNDPDDDSESFEGFDSVAIRNNFVRKVYAILSVQLFVTFGFVVLAIYQKKIRSFILRDTIFTSLSSFMFLVLMIVLMCYQYTRRTFPLNFILLSLLTISAAYWTAAISCQYDTDIVMITLGVTALVCVSISLLAWQTSFDITGCTVFLYIASLIVIIYGIIAVIIFYVTGSRIAYLIYACLITVIFCMYLMYDTQQILGGRRFELSPEEYICGALTLYIDIIMIFVYLLQIFGYNR